MPVCLICHHEVADADGRSVASDGRVLIVHPSCFADFSSLVKEALNASSLRPPAVGLDRLAKNVNGRLVLVHRNFPNEQMPFLVYLATERDPVIVADLYKWAEQNELRIRNPANQVLRLKEKGLLATYHQA